MAKAESPAGIIILSVIGVVVVATLAAIGINSFLDARNQQAKIDRLEARLAAAPLKVKDKMTDLPSVFKDATKYPSQLYYVVPSGAKQPKSDVDALTKTERAVFMAYIVSQDGWLAKDTCAQINSSDGSWTAGYCTSEVIKKFGKDKGPVG
jgi:type II secretory pathway pseudopilin PulG